MVKQRPQTLEEMSQIWLSFQMLGIIAAALRWSGVGAMKLEKYGVVFLGVLME